MKTSSASSAWASPAVGGRLDVAEVAARAAEPSRPDWLARMSRTSSSVMPVSRRMTGRAKTSKSPTRLFCGRPDCGLMPRLDATDLPSRMAQSDELPPRWQEMTLRSLAAEQLGHPAGDVAMAGAVEAPAADAELGRPLVGDGVALVGLGDRPVEAGLERGDQRQLREPLAEHPHRLDVRRIVRGGDVGERLHRLEHVLVDPLHAGEVPGVDRLEADRRDLGGVLEHAELGVGQLVEAELHGVAVVGDRLDQLDARPWPSGSTTLASAEPIRSIAPARQQRLGRVAEVEEAILEAGAAEVGDEDLHRRAASGERRDDGVVRAVG